MADTLTTTLGELVRAEQALTRLQQLRLPAKTAYHIAKLSRLVAVEIEHFTTTKNTLIKELGTERDAANEAERTQYGDRVTVVSPEHERAFMVQINELLVVECVIAWGPLTLDLLGGAEISAADLLALGPLIVAE